MTLTSGRTIIDEVKDRLDIADVVGAQVELRPAGRSLKGLCPFHQEKTPSFTVNPERRSYHCFGCGKSGDVISFVMETEHLAFKDALRQLAERAGIRYEEPKPRPPEEESAHKRLLEVNRLAARYYNHLLLNSEAAAHARAYLEGRGIARAAWETWMLGYAPNAWDATLKFLGGRNYSAEEALAAGLVVQREGGGQYDRFRERIMFPIRDPEGAVIAFGGRAMGDGHPKYLNSPESPLFTKGAHLYGLDLAREHIRTANQAVVVEGYVDAIAAHAGGFPNVVATLGTAITPNHVRVLSRLTRNVVLALDADAAGDTAAMRGWEVLRDTVRRRLISFTSRGRVVGSQRQLEMTVRIARLPRGEDPDTLIRSDPERWRALIAEARPVVEHFFETVRESADLSTPEGRTSAVSELAPVISDLDNPIEKAHYVSRLAQMAGVGENEILGEVSRAGQAVRARKREAATYGAIRQVTVEEMTLALLLRYPRLLAQAPENLGDALEQSQHRELLAAMAALGPERLTPDALLEAVGESPLGEHARAIIALMEQQPELLSNEQPLELRHRLGLIRQRRLRELINQHSAMLKEATEMGDPAAVRALLEGVPPLATEARAFDPPKSPYFKDSRG